MPSLKPLYQDPTGQVALWQSGDRYFDLLSQRFGDRFIEYRRRWQETSVRGDSGDFPLSLDLAINSGCQLSCLMCPLPSRPEARQVRLMEPALFQRLLDEAEEHALPAMTIGLGSEPLLHPEAPALAAAAARAGVMDIRLGTNGLALTGDMSQALIDSGLTRLEISIDAARPETYKTIRGGSLERLTGGIDDFLNLRQKSGSSFPLLRLSFLKLPHNEGELEIFLNRWEQAADMISIQEPIWFPGSRLPKPQRENALPQVDCDLSLAAGAGLDKPITSGDSGEAPESGDRAPGRPMALGCAQCWQRLAVNFDGRVWPCCSWYGENLLPFNAADLSIADIWKSAPMNDLRQSLLNASPPAACASCEY